MPMTDLLDELKRLRDRCQTHGHNRYQANSPNTYSAGFDVGYALAKEHAARELDAVIEKYEGYVMVPVEPTEKMMEAGFDQAFDSGDIYTNEPGVTVCIETHLPRAVYNAMIAAAQPPQTDE